MELGRQLDADRIAKAVQIICSVQIGYVVT